MSRTCAISSPGWNASRFATCWPLASRPPSGSSYAFARYTRPRLVKNSSQWCVVVTKKCSTTSSLRSCAPADALAAAALRPVLVGPGALGVAAAGDGDDDLLLGDEVLDVHVAVERQDLGAPGVAELVDDLGELLGHDPALPLGRGEDVVVVGDLELERGQLVDDALALERGQAPQLQVEDRAGLLLVDVEQRHQAVRASSADGELRISAMTSSSASSALTKPRYRVGPTARPLRAGTGCAGRRPRSGGRPSAGRTCPG